MAVTLTCRCCEQSGMKPDITDNGMCLKLPRHDDPTTGYQCPKSGSYFAKDFTCQGGEKREVKPSTPTAAPISKPVFGEPVARRRG